MADGSVLIQVGADTRKAQKELARLETSMRRSAAALEKTGSEKSYISQDLEKARAEAEKLKAEIDDINKRRASALQMRKNAGPGQWTPDIENVYQSTQDKLLAQREIREKALAASEKEIAKLANQEEKITRKLEMQTAEYDKQKAAVADLRAQMLQTGGQTMEKIKAGAESVSQAFRGGLKWILKWGIGIRSIFILARRIRSAISEGFKAFIEQDPETKANVDALKASFNGLKLALGAAFAPIANAAIPLLQKLVGWLTTAANAVNMFISALQGKSTYKKVSANMDSVAKSASGAGNAAEKAKKQILGFDEITRLEGNDSSGGGSGGGAGAALGDMEETAINPKLLSFLDKVKEHLTEIALIAGTIAAAFLAWKLSDLLGMSFTRVLGILMTIYGAILLIVGAVDAWKNGLNDENISKMLDGVAIAAAGAALAFGAVGAGIALIVGGITFLVLGIKELIQTGELTDETFKALAIGIGLVGAGFALLTGSWIPLVVAGVAVLALTIAKNWDKIEAAAVKLKEKVVAAFKAIKEKALEYFGPLLEDIELIWTGIKNIINGVIDFVVGVFTGDWDRAWSGVCQIFTGYAEIIIGSIQSLFDFIAGLISAVSDALSWLQGLFQGINEVANNNAIRIEADGSLYLQGLARGGIVDGPTPVIVGDAGREAVIPLERNTVWIKEIADQMLNTMGNRYAGALVGMPAMAMGGVVPPRAVSGSSMGFSEEDIARLVSGIQSALTGRDGQTVIENKVYLDGKQISDSVTKWQRRGDRSKGT